MAAELKILGAAYGPQDVTGQVRQMKKGQKLSFKITNKTFGGDPWSGYDKTLIVVYQYDADVKTAIFKEEQHCVILPSQGFNQPPFSVETKRKYSELSVETKRRLEVGHLIPTQQASSSQATGTSHSLVVLGAAYGLKDVTDRITELLSPEGEFDQTVTNEVMGKDGWKGHDKTLVVVYECNSIPMLKVAKEHHHMYFIASPPMSILCAAYGLLDVTNKVRGLVQNRELSIKPTNELFKGRDAIVSGQ